MATVLICVSPAKGHVGPTLPIAERLVRAGHMVHVLTGRGYVDAFVAVGAKTARLPEDADFDDGYFPEREGLRGMRLARADLTGFVTRMRPQLAAMDELLAAYSIDVVLCDPLLMAGLPLTMRRRRPAGAGAGVHPAGAANAGTRTTTDTHRSGTKPGRDDDDAHSDAPGTGNGDTAGAGVDWPRSGDVVHGLAIGQRRCTANDLSRFRTSEGVTDAG